MKHTRGKICTQSALPKLRAKYTPNMHGVDAVMLTLH
jgi:hypothetical protein